MFPALTAPLDDHSEARSRVRSVGVGSRLSLAALAATLAYALSTWSSPHRMALLVLIGIAAIWTLTPVLAGAERIVHSDRRELLFLAWSVGSVALIGALVAADGGADSPLALLFVLPLAFAALSYPLPSVVAIGAADVITFVGVGLTGAEPSGSRLGFFATGLAITALLCAWEALDHDRQREALALVSRTDPLTGCLNRRGFEERFEAELDGATRSNGSLGLVMLDLDHFKAVNDTRGHAAGDDLLRWSVQRAGSTLRPMDSLGRFGGDEFAILIPGATPAETHVVADRVRHALAENVSVSVGVACFPADGVDRESLHQRADAGLYAAKDARAGMRDLDFASALAAAVNLRMAVPDEQTSTVPHFALAIADRLGFSDSDRAMLRLAATLHDVGKVSVPDRILRKPGPLTTEEFDHVKGHPAAGAEIVAHMDGLTPLAEWILHSHEHIDGSGYPHGLAGEAIPLASRVLLVADAFDAITSVRPYGVQLPAELALEELRRGAGRQFDTACVDALVGYLAEQPATLPGSVKRFGRTPAALAS